MPSYALQIEGMFLEYSTTYWDHRDQVIEAFPENLGVLIFPVKIVLNQQQFQHRFWFSDSTIVRQLEKMLQVNRPLSAILTGNRINNARTRFII